MSVTRLIAVYLVGLALLVATMASGVYGVGAQEAQGELGGVLGLPRLEVEARLGPSTEQVEMPGHPIYDETYAYEAEDATTYVSYRDINGVETAVYVELAWRGDGVDEQQAQRATESLIPADAELTELYVAPPTPGGPIALVTYRYESAGLGELQALAPEILVIHQQHWSDDDSEPAMVQSTSIMLRERTQLTG